MCVGKTDELSTTDSGNRILTNLVNSINSNDNSCQMYPKQMSDILLHLTYNISTICIELYFEVRLPSRQAKVKVIASWVTVRY